MSVPQTLPFGEKSFVVYKNSLILDTTIDYLIKTRKFEEPLFSDHQ